LQLKRAHSADPDSADSRKSPSAGPFGKELTPPDTRGGQPIPGASAGPFGKSLPDESIVGSPLKKHRASVAEGMDDEKAARPSSFPPALGDILAKAEADQQKQQQQQKQGTPTVKEEEEEEEL